MKISFAPFTPAEAQYLSSLTQVDFMRANFDSPRFLCVSARDDHNQLMGTALFDWRLSFEAHFSCAITDRRCLSRRLLKAMFTAAFARAIRIVALVRLDHEDAIRQARTMGFKDEGYARRAVEGTWDALQLSMLHEDCRYLRHAPPGFIVARNEGRHGLVA